MKINLNNYETILIDYLDGKLTANEVTEVILFLERYPEIKEEFEGVADFNLMEELPSTDFSHLLKPEFTTVKADFEQLLVAALEGDLSPTEEVNLQKAFKLYPELLQEQASLSLTKLSPDYSLVYEGKQQLKKGSLFIVYRQQIIRVAAVLVLGWLVGLTYQLLNRTDEPIQYTATAPKTNTKPIEQTVTIKPNAIAAASKQQPKNQHSAHPIVKSKKPVATQEVLLAAIEPKNLMALQIPNQLNNPLLNPTKSWINTKQPLRTQPDNRFISLQTFIRNKFAAESKEFELKTKTAIQDMNKTAGVNIKKDSTGKITHFEIGALGFAWSK
jgi:hypothetical protein